MRLGALLVLVLFCFLYGPICYGALVNDMFTFFKTTFFLFTFLQFIIYNQVTLKQTLYLYLKHSKGKKINAGKTKCNQICSCVMFCSNTFCHMFTF